MRRPSSCTGVIRSLKSRLKLLMETTSPRDTSPSSGRFCRKIAGGNSGRKPRADRSRVESFKARKHRDLHLREDLSPRRVLGMRQRRIGEELAVPDLVRTQRSQSLPRQTGARRAVGPTGSGLPRDIFAAGSRLRRQVVPALQQLALSVHDPGLAATSAFIVSSKVCIGFFALKGSREKSKPRPRPSSGWDGSAEDEGAGVPGLNTLERSCSVLRCSGRVSGTARGVWAS